MSTTPFFRLPIISFLITFCVLVAQLIIKLNTLESQLIRYNASPDFVRIVGIGLLVMLSLSICLNRIKIYQLTTRNILLLIVTVAVVLGLLYRLDIYLTDLLSAVFDVESGQGYRNFLFWFPIISRILSIIVLFLAVLAITHFVKYRLNWQDEVCRVELTDNDVAKRIQNVYFISGYLAVMFIFQRYLYIAVYLYLGNGNLSELHNFSFYLSAIMTAFLLLMYLNSKEGLHYIIDSKVVVKTVAWVVFAQLVISIIVSFITIYAVQYYFIFTAPDNEVGRYNHYLSLLYTMLNSVFAVAVLTCLLTYLAGRYCLKKANYLSVA